MKLEDLAELEAQKEKEPKVIIPITDVITPARTNGTTSFPYTLSNHKSEVCNVLGHDSDDCITGWCECKCHSWNDMIKTWEDMGMM